MPTSFRTYSVQELKGKEEDLLNKWALDCPGFIRDGLLDPESYVRAKYKILFLLKEVNGGENPESCRPLTEFLKEGGRPQTWDNVARWLIGINALPEIIPWNLLKDISDEDRKNALQQICVVNLKKTPGGSTAVEDQIDDAAEKYASELKRQIDIYNPQFIICGGTWAPYTRHIATGKVDWEMTTRGIYYFREQAADGNTRVVIDYSHPQSRTKPCLLHYGLVDAFSEIIQKVDVL